MASGRLSTASSIDDNIVDMSTTTRRSGRSLTTRLRSLSRGRRNNSIPRGRNRSLSISRKTKTMSANEGYTLDWSKKGGSSRPLGRSVERRRNRSLSISRRKSSSEGGYAMLDGKSMSVGESSTGQEVEEDDRLTQMMTAEIERVLEERRVSDDIKKKKTIPIQQQYEDTIQKLKRRLSKMETKLQTQSESQTEEVNKWKERFFHSCDQLEKMASKAEVQTKQYMKQVNDIATTHDELKQQVDHYKIENCELVAKCDRLSHKCDRLEISESKLMEERTRERQVYGDICEENEILQESVEEAMQLVNSMGKKMTRFVETHESCVQDYENKLASLRDELETEMNRHVPAMEESSSSSSSSCAPKEKEHDNLQSEIARLNTENEEAYEVLRILEQEIKLLRSQAKAKTSSKSKPQPNSSAEKEEGREEEDQIIKADRKLQQDLMSILLNNPSEVKSLSSYTGPCHICNNEDHPTLRCSFLNATRIPITIHDRLNAIKFKEENGLHTLKLKEGNVIVDVDRICNAHPRAA